MKIGFINNQPPYSGIGVYAFNLYKELRNICEIDHIFLNYQQRKLEKIEDNERTLIRKIKEIPLVDNKPLFWWRIGNMLPEYDLYHIAGHNMSFLAKGRRSIITFHGASPLCFSDSVLHFYGRRFLYSGIRYATRTIAISEFTKGTLINSYKVPSDRIKVIPLGVEPSFKPGDSLKAREKLHLPFNKKIIVHVGARGKRKNVITLIRAFSILQKSLPDLLLIRIGTERKENIKLANQLGLTKKVLFISFVPREKIALYYNASDLFVFPSFYEPFGLPILEAMASGCPVVAINATSAREVIGDAGILVDPFDTEQLTSAMLQVLTHQDIRHKMSQKALERAKMFSWRKAAEETLKVYKEVLTQNSKGNKQKGNSI